MTADDAIDEILRLARDPTLSDDALRDAVRAVIERLELDERDAAILRAREVLAEQRLQKAAAAVLPKRVTNG